MTAHAGAPALHPAALHLHTYCAAQTSWTVLDSDFGEGQSFAAIRRCWLAQSPRPRLLHYVGMLSAGQAPDLQTALRDAAPDQGTGHAALEDLAALCFGLDGGFHRFLLEGGSLSLTLCVGELPAMLAQQDMQADVVLAAAPQALQDRWQIKALARHCKRGTALYPGTPDPAQAHLLEAAGFVLQPESQGRTAFAVFNPRWTLRNSRRAQPVARTSAGRCAVIGAGIAGASVARALALRGWMVDVFDTQPQPAGGASGLPVGLVVPHHSADDSPRSRMSRAGTRLMLQHAAALHAGQDWNPCGVLELHPDAAALDAVEAEVRSELPSPGQLAGWASEGHFAGLHGLWHPHAAWIKPARLVAHWLGHAGVRFHGHCCIDSLEREGDSWLLHDAPGHAVGRADTVVFANAYACKSLLLRMAAQAPTEDGWLPDILGKLQALQALHGTLSTGTAVPDPAWPSFPVNGHGSFVSGIPTDAGPGWFAGSTFRTDASALTQMPQEQATNLAKLQVLLPQVAAALSGQFEGRRVSAWQNTRCVTHDRLPLVGPLEDGPSPTLWLSAGMGARGLSFSALCAELIVAWMGGEPLPIESRLAAGLSTRRARRKRAAPDQEDQGRLDSMQV